MLKLTAFARPAVMPAFCTHVLETTPATSVLGPHPTVAPLTEIVATGVAVTLITTGKLTVHEPVVPDTV